MQNFVLGLFDSKSCSMCHRSLFFGGGVSNKDIATMFVIWPPFLFMLLDNIILMCCAACSRVCVAKSTLLRLIMW